jgi:hypothetical protein
MEQLQIIEEFKNLISPFPALRVFCVKTKPNSDEGVLL